MKKIITFVLIFLFILINTSYATWDIRDYFVLDKWHDIWNVQTTNGWYYNASISYTEHEKVKKLMDKNYDFEYNFYSNHNFLKEYINGKNNDSYFYVKWDNPVIFNNINDIRNITWNFYYSYRKNWVIEWTKWTEMMSSFITGYNSEKNKITILFPIKNKFTWFTDAFLQYPCWNLVCKDKDCSALKSTKKEFKCSLNSDKNVLYDNENIMLNINKNYPELMIKTIYVNWKETINNVEKNNFSISKPTVWNYEISATASNPYNNQIIKCDNINITVNKTPYCWDWVVDKWEQCDVGNMLWSSWCNKCVYEKPSCNISSKNSCIENWTKIQDIFNINENNWILSKILLNGQHVDKTYQIYSQWINTVNFIYANPLNYSIENMCKADIKVRSNAFCGDWILNNNEICDPNDSLTWAMCTKTCEAKIPDICDINITWDLVTWKKIFLGVRRNYYTEINELSINWKPVKIIDYDYWTFTFSKPWIYEVKVMLSNKLNLNILNLVFIVLKWVI